MAVFIGPHEMGEVFAGHFPVSMIFIGKNLVWPEEQPTPQVKACFSGGIWDDTLPWLDEEIWLDTIP
jgi:hypothetical protein